MFSAVREAGYNVRLKMLNAAGYAVPQDRKRVFYIGFRKDLNIEFSYPSERGYKLTLKDAIWDSQETALPAKAAHKSNNAIHFVKGKCPISPAKSPRAITQGLSAKC